MEMHSSFLDIIYKMSPIVKTHEIAIKQKLKIKEIYKNYASHYFIPV